MRSPDEILFNHSIEHLPADVDHRRELLNALHNRLDPQSEAHKAVVRLLEGLDHHLSRLRELNLTAEGGR